MLCQLTAMSCAIIYTIFIYIDVSAWIYVCKLVVIKAKTELINGPRVASSANC